MKLPPITLATFQTEVLDADRPVLVNFTAAWCPPCRALEPILSGLLAEADGRFEIVTVDVDAHPTLAERYGVRSAPTLIAFVKGQPTHSHIGLTTRAKLLEMVK